MPEIGYETLPTGAGAAVVPAVPQSAYIPFLYCY
jgi:hypothetical protein